MKAIIQIELTTSAELQEKADCVAMLLLHQLDISGRRYFEIAPGTYPVIDIATDFDGQTPEIIAKSRSLRDQLPADTARTIVAPRILLHRRTAHIPEGAEDAQSPIFGFITNPQRLHS